MRLNESRPYGWLKRVLSRPGAAAACVALGMLLSAASLDTGLGADDHIQQLILKESSSIPGFVRAPLDLFRFADPANNASLRDEGVFPWWADPETRLSFFRPLSSLTHFVDHALWPKWQSLAHLQSVLWLGLGFAGLAALYRRLVQPPWVAALAVLAYAVDDARGEPIAWIANRNAVIACSLSVWCLVYFHRYRADGYRLGAWIAFGTFLLALLSGEGAIATCGYLFAYAVCLDRGPWSRRLARLAPYAAIVVAWRLAVGAFGYGVERSGVYVDPIREPALFIAMVFERLPILLSAQLAGPWAAVWNASQLVLPGIQYGLMILALAVLGLTAHLILPLWRRDRVVRFWVVGSVLSGIPVCATFPADRLLTWVAIGASPLVATLFVALVEDAKQRGIAPWSPRVAALSAVGLAAIHFVIAPLTLPMRARGIKAVREMLSLANDSVPKTPDITEKTLVFLNPPADPFASYVPIMRADAGELRFARQRWLATGTSDVTLERMDRRTFRVRPDGGFLISPSERMLRSLRHPMKLGDEVRLTGMTVSISELTWDGRPAEAVVRFDRDADDPSIVWLEWRGRGYAPFALPAVGATVVVPKADFLKIAYGA